MTDQSLAKPFLRTNKTPSNMVHVVQSMALSPIAKYGRASSDKHVNGGMISNKHLFQDPYDKRCQYNARSVMFHLAD